MPVEMIGEAMLRGMGWQPGAGVGKNKKVFDPIVLVKRPGRLGLGAKLQQVLPPTHGKSKDASAIVRQGESRAPTPQMGALNADGTFKSRLVGGEQLVPLVLRQFAPGVECAIVGGRHAGLYGRVASLDDDGARINVRLTSDELVSVDKLQLEFRDEHDARKQQSAPASKRRKKSSSSTSTSTSSSKKSTKPTELWLRPNIMVRIVSKKFRDGRFYEKKARVVDCVGGDLCTLELADGRVLDAVRQAYLENVVGRKGQRVQLLRGAQSGQLGSVLERDAKSQRCLVQLESSMQAHRLPYDDVALYVGPPAAS
jgi:G patch domain/KOW motif-containing protein